MIILTTMMRMKRMIAAERKDAEGYDAICSFAYTV